MSDVLSVCADGFVRSCRLYWGGTFRASDNYDSNYTTPNSGNDHHHNTALSLFNHQSEVSGTDLMAPRFLDKSESYFPVDLLRKWVCSGQSVAELSWRAQA